MRVSTKSTVNIIWVGSLMAKLRMNTSAATVSAGVAVAPASRGGLGGETRR